MKRFTYTTAAFLALVLAWAGCTKVQEFDNSGSAAVTTLLYPVDGYEADLINESFAKMTFEWANAEGTGTPEYRVVFYEDAEQTSEIASYPSDNNGMETMLTLTQSKIVEMADMIGIEPLQSGDLYWSVYATVGTNVQTDLPAARKLTVTRDETPVDAPSKIYLTGAGTEAGADVNNAIQIYSSSEGVFEMYTRLNGEYCFVNRAAEGSKRTFYVTADGHLTTVSGNAADTEEGVYRMKVDFNENTVSLDKIEHLYMQQAGVALDSGHLAELAYAGNGTWKTTSQVTIISSGDERYRFAAVVNDTDGSGIPNEIWGSTRNDDQDGGEAPSLDPSNPYYNIAVWTGEQSLNENYYHIFKPVSAIRGMQCDVVVSMNGERKYHYFDFGFDVSDIPEVSILTAPADDASVELETISGAKETFSWEKPQGDEGQIALTTYSLVLFSDAAGTERIASYSAGSNTSIDITHMQLEEAATSAGIAAGETGDLWWGVETSLIGGTAMSSVINHLTVTRMKGVPEVLYFTGDGTEFGSGYGQMKKTATGQFEIYTELTNGQSYSITDEQDGTGRSFSLEDGSFTETGSASSWGRETGIYRIRIDYMDMTATVEKIGRVWMEVCAYKSSNFTLEYDGNGIWNANSIIPDFTREPDWGGDTRFFVKMDIDGKTWKLAHQSDFGGSDPTTPAPEGDPAYQISFWDDDDDWAYHYKVVQAYRGQNTKRLNLTVNCSPQTDNYYVYVEYLDL